MKTLTNESGKTSSGKSSTTFSALDFGNETYTAMKDASGNVYVVVDVDASSVKLGNQSLLIRGAIKLVSAKDPRGYIEFDADNFTSKQVVKASTTKVKVFIDLSTKK